MQIKLRRRDPEPVGEDLNSILAALEANNPEDAQAARQVSKRQVRGAQSGQTAQGDDLNSILAALEANNPEDAQAARQVNKRQVAAGGDLNSILAALEANNPEDAAAARQGPA
jgi:predicted RNA-binding Zn ribbon-like protein